MKIFVSILVASTLALANADISLKTGYTYSNNVAPQGYYMQQQPQYPVQPNNQYLPQAQYQQKQLNMNLPMPSDFPTNFDFQPAVQTKPRRYRPRSRIMKKPIVTKNFSIYSAPEETQAEIEEELASLQQQPRKHYNVLFVKTPSQTNKAAAVNLAKAIKEEKTVVYVLAKKTSAADLQDAIQEAPQQINKPEVFFIKYRTPEEAANAQRQIQSQYDRLGGSTTITDEGIAPATSVVGSLDAPEEEEVEEEQHLENSEEQYQNNQFDDKQYLPPQQPVPSSSNGYLPPGQY